MYKFEAYYAALLYTLSTIYIIVHITIPPIAKHFFVAWSACLSFVHCASTVPRILPPFGRHTSGVQWQAGEGKLKWYIFVIHVFRGWTPQPKHAIQIATDISGKYNKTMLYFAKSLWYLLNYFLRFFNSQWVSIVLSLTALQHILNHSVPSMF